MRIIDPIAIRAAVREPEALASAEMAFRALAEKAVELPAPMGFGVPAAQGEVHVKSAYLVGAPVFAVKVATGFYRNSSRGLPSGAGLILVFDAETGFPLALLEDQGYLTDLRTAAAGALAARLLSPESLSTVAVLGAGVQARFQLRALARVRSWARTLVWARDPERLTAYCVEMEGKLGRPFLAAAAPEEALRNADLVFTVTPSRAPLFEATALPSHATVIAVGSDGPSKRELPTEALVRADKIVVDRLSQCLQLGELHHAVAEGALAESAVYAELGDVLIGRNPGREADELIICDLTGVGVQDAAIAEIAWKRLAQTAADEPYD
ncbi:MAG: ornithine cyclodeaminase family protein [Gemmatimonadota bacterium]|nr:MAG: ornithine cyclodeaminase family protein [Gemmatimonadota bacterium]